MTEVDTSVRAAPILSTSDTMATRYGLHMYVLAVNKKINIEFDQGHSESKYDDTTYIGYVRMELILFLVAVS